MSAPPSQSLRATRRMLHAPYPALPLLTACPRAQPCLGQLPRRQLCSALSGRPSASHQPPPCAQWAPATLAHLALLAPLCPYRRAPWPLISVSPPPLPRGSSVLLSRTPLSNSPSRASLVPSNHLGEPPVHHSNFLSHCLPCSAAVVAGEDPLCRARGLAVNHLHRASPARASLSANTPGELLTTAMPSRHPLSTAARRILRRQAAGQPGTLFRVPFSF